MTDHSDNKKEIQRIQDTVRIFAQTVDLLTASYEDLLREQGQRFSGLGFDLWRCATLLSAAYYRLRDSLERLGDAGSAIGLLLLREDVANEPKPK